MKKIVIVLQLWAIFHGVQCGNYMKCTENFCINGSCSVMSTSPSPLRIGSDFKLSFFTSSGSTGDTWSEAEQYCQTSEAQLFSPISPSAVSQARAFLSKQNLSLTSGLWTSMCQDKSCKVIQFDTKNQQLTFIDIEKSDSKQNQNYKALCSLPADSDLFGSSAIYTCQCPPTFGYENCTKTTYVPPEPVNPGTTLCESKNDEIVLRSSPESGEIIFIDHALYGRPLYLQGSLLPGPMEDCPNDLYAKSVNEYCVSANALAAVTYWCQGKQVCTFNTSFLLDTPVLGKNYYIASLGARMTYSEAVSACQSSGHSLALVSSTEEAKRLRDTIRQNFVDDGKPIAFWIDSNSQNHLEKLGYAVPWTKQENSNNGCLVLQLPKKAEITDLYLHWKSCFSGDRQFSVVCQSGQRTRTRTGVDPEDSSCLQGIENKVFEYRFHLEKNLNSRDIACPFKVDYRRGNTCYKTTKLSLDWREAREECWRMGGELAMPLPSKDCTSPTYVFKKEQLWIAGDKDCGEERCPIPFSSKTYFIEGTFDQSNDLCFPNTSIDTSCHLGNCLTKRRGLCALPIAAKSRTALPSSGSCPPVETGSDGWFYPDYPWTETGEPGKLSKQPCPAPQAGSATWYCGLHGDWVGVPDLSSCTVLTDIAEVIDELKSEDSIPSDVIQKFSEEVESMETIGAGDIKAIINVLNISLEEQIKKIGSSSDPEQYADSFTRESLNLFDNILNRQESWYGIPIKNKRSQVTNLQRIIEDTSLSLIQNSKTESHEYGNMDNIVVKVVKNVNISEVQDFQSSGSSLQISSNSIEPRSVSFVSYKNLGCVLEELYECVVDVVEEPEKDVLNSAVLGATLYAADEGGSMIKDSENLTVILSFKHLLPGDKYNITAATCSYWNDKLEDWSQDGCHLIEVSDEYTTCQCDHLTNFGVIMDVNGNLEDQVLLNEVLNWITLLGCSFSIISLFICIYVFTAIPGLRGDRTTIHRNLCISLVCAEILLVFGLDATENAGLCATVAGFLHYFFLSSFCWMLVEGIHVYYMLVKVFDTGRSLLWIFYSVGYGLPSVIVLLSVLIAETSGKHGYGSEKSCWLSSENGLIWAFAGPVAVIIVINTAMFSTAISIARKSIQKRQSADSNSKTMTLIKGSFSLLCILGMTWVFGFTYFANGAEWLAVIFALLNSFQGFFILLFHVILNEKAKQEFTRHSKSNYRYFKSYILRKPLEPPSSITDSSMATSRSGPSKNAGAGVTDSSRKISMETTMTSTGPSAPANEHEGDNKVKYYRGQVTMTVVAPASNHPTIPELPEPEDSENQNSKKPNTTGAAFSRLRARLSKRVNP